MASPIYIGSPRAIIGYYFKICARFCPMHLLCICALIWGDFLNLKYNSPWYLVVNVPPFTSNPSPRHRFKINQSNQPRERLQCSTNDFILDLKTTKIRLLMVYLYLQLLQEIFLVDRIEICGVVIFWFNLSTYWTQAKCQTNGWLFIHAIPIIMFFPSSPTLVR